MIKIVYTACIFVIVTCIAINTSHCIPLGSNDRNQHRQIINNNKSIKRLYKHFGDINNIDEFRKRVENFTENRPNHKAFDQIEHSAKLKAMAYFFKVYNSKIDNQLQNARYLIEKYAGKAKLNNIFAGRAAMFKEGGRLEKYAPLIHELANIAQSRKQEIDQMGHHYLNEDMPKKKLPLKDAIALIEEHIDNGFIEIQEMTTGSTDITSLVHFDPMAEQRKMNSEKEYFRNYKKKKNT